ncbi:unnamed protein product [Polarella glacialis]|uniref:Uncharacterized protein n=1 Tax=Polarella glacialis TaxID=89957 RepID=A0A813K6T2_POLGL|nr:unnamed protein product [Polarella glacialis]
MTGLLGSSAFALKSIADLEYDMVNSSDFFTRFNWAHKAELGFLLLNLVSALPFMTNWWMAPIQTAWAVIKLVRALMGGHVIAEKDVFKSEVYNHQRRWQMAGFFLYLISIFIYFARAMAAVMDIHIHGISPYD